MAGGLRATGEPAATRTAPGLHVTAGSAAGGGVPELLAVVPTWWRQRARAVGLAGRWTDWRQALPDPPVPVSEQRGTLLAEACTEMDGWHLGRAYTRSLHPRARDRGGCHYTPRTLAEALWAEVQEIRGSPTSGAVVDPAAGAGALLLPPLRQYVSGTAEAAPAQGVIDDVAATFAGTDTDPVAAWLGSVILAAELLPLWAQVPASRRQPLPRLITPGDGLAARDDRPAVVLLNPPYGRVRLDARARARWRTVWGHANLYALFVEAAIERVADGGVVGAVLPTSWTGGAYYQRLRGYVADVAPLTRLTWVSDRADVFADVLQETCLAVFHKREGTGSVHLSRQVVNGISQRRPLGTTKLPADRSQAWLLPRVEADVPLVRGAASRTFRLADFGWHASTGPLVWNRHKPEIHAQPRPGRTPIVWASDLDTGVVRPDPRRDRQRWIELQPEQRGVMVLAEPAILIQRTTATEQPRRLVVAVLDEARLDEWGGEVVVENHVNVLRRSDHETALTPGLLASLLRTDVLDRLYRSLSGSVAVSAYELASLPMPDPGVLPEWQRLSFDALERAATTLYQDA